MACRMHQRVATQMVHDPGAGPLMLGATLGIRLCDLLHQLYRWCLEILELFDHTRKTRLPSVSPINNLMGSPALWEQVP